VAADMAGPKKKKNRPEDKMEGKNFGRGNGKKLTLKRIKQNVKKNKSWKLQ
jgi:hypothetical protein